MSTLGGRHEARADRKKKKKKNTSVFTFQVKGVFLSENFSESRIYLTNVQTKVQDFPFLWDPLLFCFVTAKHSLLFVNALSESCLLPCCSFTVDQRW